METDFFEKYKEWRELFWNENNEKFLAAGFKKCDEDDCAFLYQKDLVYDDDKEYFEGTDLSPKLLFGSTGLNRGYCIFTGAHFVWTDFTDPGEAARFADHIMSFEEV